MSSRTWETEHGKYKEEKKVIGMKCPKNMSSKHYREKTVDIRVTKKTNFRRNDETGRWANLGSVAADVSCKHLVYDYSKRPITTCKNHIDHDGPGGICHVVSSCIFDGDLGYVNGPYTYKNQYGGSSVKLP